jgi:hypothetical protein
MLRKLLQAAVVAVLLVACTQAGVAPPAAGASAGASAGRWEMMTHIRFAVFSAAGDLRQYDVTFSCDASERVRVYYVVAPDEMLVPPHLVLSSGLVSETLTAEQYENRSAPPPVVPAPSPGPVEGYTVMADMALDAPVLAAFQRTGALEVSNGRATLDASADTGEVALLQSYFARCGS